MEKKVAIQVYGAEQICASCVGAPSSKDTFEWLKAALSRKYPGQPFDIQYIDIFAPGDDQKVRAFAQKVMDEDLFYPVVVIEGEPVAEGNPRLKKIYAVMEQYGYIPENAFAAHD
ncbi:YuzD family protein [Heyndrickxia coagulans]|uniref:YuzD family protein n=1 Tax=Heyndrickxia coagulans TaxID=1398 RepID=A0AAW7CN16_HEYCO|nr:YuzD family protein [Heyndrickxia coagulans]MDL5042356.1 YuzD family protein [Heyndrickxia coagulans]